MAQRKQVVALALVGASAMVEGFVGGHALVGKRGTVATLARMPSVRTRAGVRMQVQAPDGEAVDEVGTKTILRVPWGPSLGGQVKPAAAVGETAEAPEAQAASTPTPPPPAPESPKKQAPAARKATEEPAKKDPNELALMAVKAGALKQSSPLIMSVMAGNKGFDPANFAKSPDLLLQYREAELKHARLAMLASVGWVMSELWHTPISDLLGKENLLQEDAGEFLAKAPSVLNGGLQSVPPFFWVTSFLFAGVVEAWRMLNISDKPMSFTPGALGFDPLGFYEQETAKGKLELETKEINNGRLAMIAIAFFAAAEFAGNTAIVDQTPWMFTEGPLANAGNLGGLLEQYSGLLSCKSGLVYCTDGQDVMSAMMQNDASNADYINEIMGE